MNRFIELLIAALEAVNPAILKHLELVRLDHQGKSFSVSAKAFLEMKPEIDRAIQEGQAELKAVSDAERALRASSPTTNSRVPVGF